MNPDELRQKLVKAGTEKARTAAYFSTMDRLRKQIRAKWVVNFINAENTVGKSEHMALIQTEYIDACKKCEEAEGAAGVAAVEYAAALAWFDAWRTLESTKRAEMGLR